MKRSSLRGSTYVRLVQYAKLSGAANTAVNYAGFLPSCASKPNDDNDDKNTQPCLDAGGEGSRCWRLAASLPGHVGDAVDGEGASSLRWRREKSRGGGEEEEEGVGVGPLSSSPPGSGYTGDKTQRCIMGKARQDAGASNQAVDTWAL